MSSLARRLSPAFVLSMIALFVALGGTGYAAFDPLNTTAKAPTVRPALFAVVDQSGNLWKSRGAISSTKNGTGEYQVTFNRNLDKCAAVASTGGHKLTSNTSTGTSIGTASASTNGNTVDVFTQYNGVDYPRTFHLIVVC